MKDLKHLIFFENLLREAKETVVKSQVVGDELTGDGIKDKLEETVVD